MGDILERMFSDLIYGNAIDRASSIASIVIILMLFFSLLVVLYHYIDEKVNVKVAQCEEKCGIVTSYKAGYTDINLINICGTLTPMPIEHPAEITVDADGVKHKINIADGEYGIGDSIQILVKTRYRKGMYYDTVASLAK